jgi:hypothetical protein
MLGRLVVRDTLQAVIKGNHRPGFARQATHTGVVVTTMDW